MFAIIFTLGYGYNEEEFKDMHDTAIMLITVGSALLLGNLIYGILSPLRYTAKSNSALKNALSLNGTNRVSVVPIVDPFTCTYGIGMCMRF